VRLCKGIYVEPLSRAFHDPDEIRAELMNFRATEKPCCSPFTAEDPAE